MSLIFETTRSISWFALIISIDCVVIFNDALIRFFCLLVVIIALESFLNLNISKIGSSVFLVIGVLLHSAKGEGLGGIGGSAHVFSSQKGLKKKLYPNFTVIKV